MTESPALIECSFSDEDSLYRAYMPFIKGGGVFIQTEIPYELGAELTLSVQLPQDTEQYFAEGKVAWITPKGAQGNKPVGIGVQLLGETGRKLSNKIETILAGVLKSTQGTNTL